MDGLEMLIMGLGAINVAVAIALGDPMTWRTHRWGAQAAVMVCGVLAATCTWLGWSRHYLELAVCVQLGVLALLLHVRERSEHVD